MVAIQFVQKYGEAFLEGQMQVAEFVKSFKQQQKVCLLHFCFAVMSDAHHPPPSTDWISTINTSDVDCACVRELSN